MLMKSFALLLASIATYPAAPAKQHPQGAASTLPSRSVSFGQKPSPVMQRQAEEYARRDLKLERDALAQRQKVDAMLPPWAKQRLELASKAFLKRLLSERQSANLSQVVKEEVGKQFRDISPQQSNILTLHVLTSVVKMLPPHSAKKVDVEAERDGLSDKKDSISEMGETDMLMLQQMMEKKGQLESMISNVMKAGFEGGQAAIQALKAS
jgi:hypothetical protein